MSSTTTWEVKGDNRPSMTVCTLSMIIIGILMIFAGGLLTYIYFTEITPPNYDAYYQRYVGSSFPRIVGILILLAGLTLFWGASIFLVYSNWRKSNQARSGLEHRRHYYGSDRVASPMPRDTPNTVRHFSDGGPTPTLIKENYVA